MVDRISYQGDGIGLVDDKGRVAIPSALRTILAANSPRADGKDGGSVIIGVHPKFPCLRAYDPAYADVLRAELDHRVATYTGADGEPNYAFKQRGASGEAVPFDGSGRCIMPGFPRDYAQIDANAFFWGSMDWIEIWDPRTLIEADGADPLVKAACRYHCKQKGIAL
ncbi:MAG: division/cell wall cluster transcriptional repressor MraZ [Pseudomonadota bacterium]|nr:division/cell wall cluster transcriptional repressor MraZ [Pseudomonadota bacterium]